MGHSPGPTGCLGASPTDRGRLTRTGILVSLPFRERWPDLASVWPVSAHLAHVMADLGQYAMNRGHIRPKPQISLLIHPVALPRRVGALVAAPSRNQCGPLPRGPDLQCNYLPPPPVALLRIPCSPGVARPDRSHFDAIFGPAVLALSVCRHAWKQRSPSGLRVLRMPAVSLCSSLPPI